MDIIQKNSSQEVISIKEIIKLLKKNKLILLILNMLILVPTLIYVFNIPDLYRSEAVLLPSSDNSNMKLPGQLGGLAAIAGVNLNSGSGNKVSIAIEILKSRKFLTEFVADEDVKIELLAVKYWDKENNSLIIDNDIYDTNRKKWTVSSIQIIKNSPSNQYCVDLLKKNLLVTEDKTSGIVKISMQHKSPFIAKKWVDQLVKKLNKELRDRDIKEAQESIIYLTKEIEKTSNSNMKNILYSLLEEQNRILLLASIKDEYIFKTIDPPVVPEMKDSPARLLIIFSIFIGSFLMSSIVVVIRDFINKKVY